MTTARPPVARPAPARAHPGPRGVAGHTAGGESNFPDTDESDHLTDQPDPPPPIPGEGKGAKLPST
jgi:hypothetical protein